MGVYDIVDIDGCTGAQVKCWGSHMIQLTLGDKVPDIEDGVSDYGVALREGGFLLVFGSKIRGWAPLPPIDLPIFDKWGSPLAAESTGLLGEEYSFKDTAS